MLPDAHARRAPHDAAGGRPQIRRRRRRRQVVPRAAAAVRCLRGGAGGADPARSGDRLRQDRAAQPRAAQAPGRAVRARSPDPDRHLAQAVSRSHPGTRGRPKRAGRRRRSAGRHARLQRARLRARRQRLPGPRGRSRSRRPGSGGCYVGPEMNGAEQGDDPDDLDDEQDRDLGEDGEETAESVTVEITGLSLYTHHGVTEAEREVGQRLVLDLRLDLGETDATVTDSIEDTVDYAEVCQLVALIAQQRSHKTLERLCSTIADRLLADYELEGVWVKAAKPEPPIALSVDEVSVEVWREASA